MTRNFAIAGLGTGTQQVYVYVPSTYTPARDWPLVLALHGAGGPGTAAAAAAAARDEWATIAESFGFIVAAPAGSGSSGGWIAPYAPGSGPSDYDLIAAVRDTLLAEYNINRARSYVWGYLPEARLRTIWHRTPGTALARPAWPPTLSARESCMA